MTVAALATVGLLAVPGRAHATTATAYGGSATGIIATLPVVGTVTVGATGSLPSTGGSLSTTTVSANVGPGAVVADVLPSTVVGSGNTTTANAKVTGLTVSLAGVAVGADVVSSTASASCGADGPSTSGSSVLTNLVVNGTPVTITGSPNQTITLAGVATIVINQQTTSSSGTDNKGITVNALHITLVGGLTDIIIAQSVAEITCTSVTAASYSRLRVHTAHGKSVLRWMSSDHVAGFNVYDGQTRLNAHLITSTTHAYHFVTSHALHRTRIVAVMPNGSSS